MNISFIIAAINAGGTYFRSHNLARALNLEGHRVRVFAVDQNPRAKPRTEVRDSIEYHIARSFRGQGIFTQEHHPMVAITRSLANYGPSDIIHVFEPVLITFLPWWNIVRKRTSTACWYDWCDLWTDGGMSGSKTGGGFRQAFAYASAHYIEKVAPSLADGVSTISGFLSAEAHSRGARRTVLVRNGVWPVEIVPKSDARREFRLDSQATYLGFMGRTISDAELEWCAAGLLASRSNGWDVRLALCGMDEDRLQCMPDHARQYVDYRGYISEAAAGRFSMAVDVGLIPLEDTLFNRSRVPVKLTSHLSSGTPVLVSEVGDCEELAKTIPGAIGAGRGRGEWIASVNRTVERSARGEAPNVCSRTTTSLLSWQIAGRALLEGYLAGAETQRAAAPPKVNAGGAK
jgi:glycosyltransferase involved in cell wall biosynthesis